MATNRRCLKCQCGALLYISLSVSFSLTNLPNTHTHTHTHTHTRTSTRTNIQPPSYCSLTFQFHSQNLSFTLTFDLSVCLSVSLSLSHSLTHTHSLSNKMKSPPVESVDEILLKETEANMRRLIQSRPLKKKTFQLN